VNTLTGLFASTLCCLPYHPWKYVHAEQHAWAGTLKRDPSLSLLRTYRRPDHASPTRWIVELGWRTGLPILGFCQQIVFWAYPLSDGAQRRLDRGKLLRCVGSVAFLSMTYTTLHAAFPSLFRLHNFALGAALYLVLVEVVNFPHHLGMDLFEEETTRLPLWEQWRVTRSCYYAPAWSLVLLNFNFHIEHHLFPDLPWHELRHARELVRAALDRRYEESVGAWWTLHHRWRAPERALVRGEGV
jgi:fatty acid desaturase